jgi:hypothetical protein
LVVDNERHPEVALRYIRIRELLRIRELPPS